MLVLPTVLFVSACSEAITPDGSAAPAVPRPTIVYSSPTPTEGNDQLYEVTVLDSFACEHPTQQTLGWLFERYSDPTWRASDVMQVPVGSGISPDEDWWLVAVRSHDAAREIIEYMIFLTNAPRQNQSTDELWIRVDSGNVLPGIVDDGWELVQWPDELIENGRRAEEFITSCFS